MVPGKFEAGIDVPSTQAFEQLETNLAGRDQELFVELIRKMLQWIPEDRKTCRELLDDPWLKEQQV